MADLYELDAVELIDLYRQGEASPVEVVESCIGRIETIEPEVNAVVTLCAEEALADAALAAGRRARPGHSRECRSA
jgi:Asp-tRNA(Asn)/Glu-tRNA(Gln) amidotransferase A subunit family amidase